MLTDDEVEQVLISALRAAARVGRAGLTSDELKQSLDWAHEVRVAATLLQKVLAGEVGAYPAHGELMFGLTEDEP